MNKIYIAIIAVIITMSVIFLSFKANDIAVKRSLLLIEKADLENSRVLLALGDAYNKKNEYMKARAALSKFLEEYPDSTEASRIRKDIENLNIKIIFSDKTDVANTTLYEIKPGDTLTGIASKFGTTVELIEKSNNLKTDIIVPGKALKVNTSRFVIMVDRSDNILTLKRENGEVVKTYTVSTGENFSTPLGTFKIEEKMIKPLWYKVGAVVSPESSEYELGSRWIGLSVSGYGIHGTNNPDSIGRHITKGCVRMKNEEVEELYALVPSGTEVTIAE